MTIFDILLCYKDTEGCHLTGSSYTDKTIAPITQTDTASTGVKLQYILPIELEFND